MTSVINIFSILWALIESPSFNSMVHDRFRKINKRKYIVEKIVTQTRKRERLGIYSKVKKEIRILQKNMLVDEVPFIKLL